VALIGVVVGAAGSVGATLLVGHRNDSRILLALFAIWVLSPFMALGLTDIVSKRSAVLTRVILHGVMLILTLGSFLATGHISVGSASSFRLCTEQSVRCGRQRDEGDRAKHVGAMQLIPGVGLTWKGERCAR
jgi:hypothetical protein